MQIINGKALAATLTEQIKNQVQAVVLQGKRKPCLAVVLIEGDSASAIYVANKQKACEKALIDSISIYKPASITQADLETIIQNLNNDKNVDGILVQLPLPRHIDKDKIINLINPAKDVDGFCTQNTGKLFENYKTNDMLFNSLSPCTPKGCIYCLLNAFEREGLSTDGKFLGGKSVCILGSSNIVGRPLANMCITLGATVSVCNSTTKNISFYTKNADIIIAAVGRAELVNGDMLKSGAIVIDVGINRVEGSNKIVGDVNFESISEVASYATPVPGGVGPLTIAFLLQNTLFAYLKTLH